MIFHTKKIDAMQKQIKIESDERIDRKGELKYYIKGAEKLKRKREFNIKYKGRNLLPVLVLAKGLRHKVFDSCWCCGHVSVMFTARNMKPVTICIEDDGKGRHRHCYYYNSRNQCCIALNKKKGICKGMAS